MMGTIVTATNVWYVQMVWNALAVELYAPPECMPIKTNAFHARRGIQTPQMVAHNLSTAVKKGAMVDTMSPQHNQTNAKMSALGSGLAKTIQTMVQQVCETPVMRV